MKLKIKFTSELAREIYARREKPLAWVYGDSAMDLSYVGDAPISIPARGRYTFPTGIMTAIADVETDNYETQIRPRSGLNAKGIRVAFGTIDFTYRGEYGVILYNHTDTDFVVSPGDRIAQLVVAPIYKPEIEFVESLDETERGEKGFGASGIK